VGLGARLSEPAAADASGALPALELEAAGGVEVPEIRRADSAPRPVQPIATARSKSDFALLRAQNVGTLGAAFRRRPQTMASVIIVGDGPGGLSAALFLAKNKQDVTVFGQNETWMNSALLFNYLGIPKITGKDFLAIAKKQVTDQGGKLVDADVSDISQGPTGFSVQAAGKSYEAKYLIIAMGTKLDLVKSLGLPARAIEADRNGRTSVEGVYVVGWATRPDKIQAIISAGDGASAALDILSKEAGKDIHDFDSVD
jgi:alkyl hydroperoxide reductase subunit AhpF